MGKSCQPVLGIYPLPIISLPLISAPSPLTPFSHVNDSILAVPAPGGCDRRNQRLVLGSTSGLIVPESTSAIQYADGTVGFSYPPRLIDSYATRNQVGDGSATYYLTFDFPPAAAEPLDRVVVRLNEGYDPLFRFRLDAIEAFANTPEGRVPLPLGELSQDRDTRELTILFDPPVQPGVPITPSPAARA
jgi:hypothetical protein